MKRRYETTIEIKPIIGNVGFESGTDSGDDIDSIQSEFYESALEQVERNFCEFNPAKINITEPASIESMFFEKKSFFYWLEDGIVELTVESRQRGKWKTLDNNISAKGLLHKKLSSYDVSDEIFPWDVGDIFRCCCQLDNVPFPT